MERSRFQLAQKDAVAWLRTLADTSVDLIITDPPYESLEKHRAVGTTTRLKNSKASSNDWFDIFPNDRFEELFLELYRVLKKDRHFYLFCDAETMFVAKPIGERVGFKFWKPLIWDKCLGPDTLVWSERGAVRIADVQVGDRVAVPEGGTARVRGVRRTRSPARRLQLADGTELIASLDHRLVLADGRQVEARDLEAGYSLARRPIKLARVDRLRVADLIPDTEAVYELPPTDRCLWCGKRFDNSRAAAAHQARFCEYSRSKEGMARELGVSSKRLRRWLGDRRVPAIWAKRLGLESRPTRRTRCYLQNDADIWFPEYLPLDYELGKLVGLFAAEGSFTAAGVSFALQAGEKHLRHHIERMARTLGVRARVYLDGNRAQVHIDFKVARYLLEHFVGGRSATSKFFRAAVYAAPDEFQRGVLSGLLEGDGHWSSEEQRETLNVASADLATYALRALSSRGVVAKIRRFENGKAGGWRVRHDPRPAERSEGVVIESIDDIGLTDLVDVSIDHPDELFVLGNGVVSHNCKIGMGYHYRARYECILFFEKGKRKLNDLGVADIIEAPRIYRGYPAEKPPEVSGVLIEQSTDPGELVIDPFCGSGSAGVAAARAGRAFAGNDICAEAVDIAYERIREAGGIPDPQLVETGASGGVQLGLGIV